MKIVFNNSQKMNEIIFANRNKNYGAYAIRSAYNSVVLKSIFIVTSSVFIFSFGLYLIYRSNVQKETVYTGTNDSVQVTFFDNKPDDFEKPKEKTPPKTPAAFKSAVLSTNISDTTTIENNNNVVNGNQDPNGNPNGDPNANSSLGTGTATAPPTTYSPAIIEEPTAFPSENPEFEGGNRALLDFIAKNIVYPGLARDAGAEGTVYVSFIIDETGSVENAKVLKGIGYGCDEESVRVINKIPKFKKPGRNTHGKPVKVIYNIPIKFKLK